MTTDDAKDQDEWETDRAVMRLEIDQLKRTIAKFEKLASELRPEATEKMGKLKRCDWREGAQKSAEGMADLLTDTLREKERFFRIYYSSSPFKEKSE